MLADQITSRRNGEARGLGWEVKSWIAERVWRSIQFAMEWLFIWKLG
jgi:hypothetical protein